MVPYGTPNLQLYPQGQPHVLHPAVHDLHLNTELPHLKVETCRQLGSMCLFSVP